MRRSPWLASLPALSPASRRACPPTNQPAPSTYPPAGRPTRLPARLPSAVPGLAHSPGPLPPRQPPNPLIKRIHPIQNPTHLRACKSNLHTYLPSGLLARLFCLVSHKSAVSQLCVSPAVLLGHWHPPHSHTPTCLPVCPPTTQASNHPSIRLTPVPPARQPARPTNTPTYLLACPPAVCRLCPSYVSAQQESWGTGTRLTPCLPARPPTRPSMHPPTHPLTHASIKPPTQLRTRYLPARPPICLMQLPANLPACPLAYAPAVPQAGCVPAMCQRSRSPGAPAATSPPASCCLWSPSLLTSHLANSVT